jgi:hypothetical protein
MTNEQLARELQGKFGDRAVDGLWCNVPAETMLKIFAALQAQPAEPSEADVVEDCTACERLGVDCGEHVPSWEQLAIYWRTRALQAPSRAVPAEPSDEEVERAIDDGLVTRFRSALRFAASHSVISSADEHALLAALAASSHPASAGDEGLKTAREAFFDLIADAIKWDEQHDEGAIYYTLETTDSSLIPLMNALGIEQKYQPIEVDGETFPGYESPAEAIDRAMGRALSATPAQEGEG